MNSCIIALLILCREISLISSFNSLPSFVVRRNVLQMEFNWKQTKKLSEEKMTKSLESMQSQFNTLRAGGANPSILDRVFVEYFGSLVRFNNILKHRVYFLFIDPIESSG